MKDGYYWARDFDDVAWNLDKEWRIVEVVNLGSGKRIRQEVAELGTEWYSQLNEYEFGEKIERPMTDDEIEAMES